MTRRLLFFLISLFFVTDAFSQGLPGVGIDGPFVRVKRNKDGSKTVFERENDERTIVKKTFTAGGNLTLKAVYRLDKQGNPLLCNIYDGIGNKLYKTAFGYSKRPGPTFGKLVQERLFDTRVKRIDPETKKETPVHMFLYRYKPDGTAELPIGITLIKGKTAEEVFGRKIETQALPDLNELEDPTKAPANPNAKPVGR